MLIWSSTQTFCRYAGIVENKKTDGISVEEKAKAWDAIALEFNACCDGVVPARTVVRRTVVVKKKVRADLAECHVKLPCYFYCTYLHYNCILQKEQYIKQGVELSKLKKQAKPSLHMQSSSYIILICLSIYKISWIVHRINVWLTMKYLVFASVGI